MARDDLREIQAFAVSVIEFMREGSTDSHLFDPFIAAAGQHLTKRQALMLVADVVEWSQDLTGEQLCAIDSRLAERGLPTLSRMRCRQEREFALLLSRGEIVSDDEWRLIESRLSDVDKSLPHRERELANRMLLEYNKGRGAV